MATISDVAARAGVSTATVSRALNGKTTVDPELVARVIAAAEELGYRPNGLARNLRKQATAVLALVISDVENPFFTAIARGVEDLAQAAGYSVVLCNSDDDPAKERDYLEVAAQERVAGVVLSPSGAAASLDPLRAHGTPVVAVDRPLIADPRAAPVEDPADSGRAAPVDTGLVDTVLVDTVLVDTRAAAKQATAHLMGAGYQRIACVTGPAGVRTADDRLAGYRDALRAGKRRGDASLVRRAEYKASGGRRAMDELLATAVEQPDAVLVANSAMAIGVLEAVAEHGLRLGRDVGIVAFDDAPWATLIDPPLTVVAQPAYEIGMLAAQLLLGRISDPTRTPSTVTLTAQLIRRGSSQRRAEH